jgi:undecaprenyl diphosphate synthase
MDGNGRWAEARGIPRAEGHRQGAKRAKETIRAGSEMGLEVLTLYTFSLENWQRPRKEISMMMKIIED